MSWSFWSAVVASETVKKAFKRVHFIDFTAFRMWEALWILLFGAFRNTNSNRLTVVIGASANESLFIFGLAQARRIRWVLLEEVRKTVYDTNSAINIHSPQCVCCRKRIDDALIFCEICIINFVCLANRTAQVSARRKRDVNVWVLCALHAYSFLALSWFRFFCCLLLFG